MDELIKKCDTALFKAKEAGRGKFVFYNDQITREVTYKSQINEQLSDALQKKQLYLKYQPLIDNRNEIYGFEALVRWNSPTLGEISPQIFIANAEESQMIIPIGNWILQEACRTLAKINQIFDKPFVMSVNVSPVQILQKDFIDILRQILRDTDIDPKSLVLEITENVVMESSYLLDKTIETIHEIGAKIALDDFGTGYASLTYLRQLPFDNLKIDKSFVDGIFASKKEHSIIGTIVEFVHNLNMKVVAEGVETRRQYEFLKQITTDIFQGFLFSKPLLYEDLIQFIDQFYKVARQKRIDVFANKDYHEKGWFPLFISYFLESDRYLSEDMEILVASIIIIITSVILFFLYRNIAIELRKTKEERMALKAQREQAKSQTEDTKEHLFVDGKKPKKISGSIYEQIDQTLAYEKEGTVSALFYLNLDGFKSVVEKIGPDEANKAIKDRKSVV